MVASPEPQTPSPWIDTHLYMKLWMRGPVRGRSRRLAARRMVVLKLCSWSRSFCCWGSRGGPWGAWGWAWGFPGGFLGTTACTPDQGFRHWVGASVGQLAAAGCGMAPLALHNTRRAGLWMQQAPAGPPAWHLLRVFETVCQASPVYVAPGGADQLSIGVAGTGCPKS